MLAFRTASPATAGNRTRLCTIEGVASSLPATLSKLETVFPVYTDTTVSKLLLSVSMVQVPDAGAVQLTQAERVPLRSSWRGSPGSLE